MVRSVLRELGPQTRASRMLMLTALAWAASGAFHLAVFAVDGGSLVGAVSWRKPIVFSVSIALTLWAFGWVLDRMPVARPRLAGALAWTFAVASTVEVALIVMQTWRGQPSHFNVFTPGDSAVFAVMGVMIAVMSAALITLLGWTLVERPADRATRWAVIGGLAAIVIGLGFGQWLVALGTTYATRLGVVPETVMNGAAIAKFPHAVALHGIQVFAILLAAANATGLDAARRGRVLRAAVAGYGGLLAFASIQTVGGLSALALRPWSLALLTASSAALAWAAWTTLIAGRRRTQGPVSLPV